MPNSRQNQIWNDKFLVDMISRILHMTGIDITYAIIHWKILKNSPRRQKRYSKTNKFKLKAKISEDLYDLEEE